MKIEDYLKYLKYEKNYNPDSILDIGANVGNFSKFCKSLWISVDILMIEGNDECENDLKRTGINYKIALLGEKNKKVNFYVNPKNLKCTGSSYYKEITYHYDNSIIIEKELQKLSDIVNNNKTFNIIKIDTQGSELDIIKGGVNIIQKADYIILEVATKQYNDGSPLYDEVVEYMGSIGFKNKEEIEKHYWMSNSIEFDYGEVFQIDIIFSK